MSLTITRCARVEDVPEALAAHFKNMPHYQSIDTARDSYPTTYRVGQPDEHTSHWDPLSTSGPNRSGLYLTGYAVAGEEAGRTIYVLRFTVNGTSRTIFTAYDPQRYMNLYDGQPTSEQTKDAAEAKAREWLAELARPTQETVQEEAERLVSYWEQHGDNADAVEKWAVSDLLKFARMVEAQGPAA